MNCKITNSQYVTYVGIGAVLMILIFSPLPGMSMIGCIGGFVLLFHLELPGFHSKRPIVAITLILLSAGFGLLSAFREPLIESVDTNWVPIVCELIVYFSYLIGSFLYYFDLKKKGTIQSNDN